MGALTESEIFSCLAENFRLAAQNADRLAISPKKGAIYNEFRKQLKLVEGAARQAAYWRQDTRWLKIGLYVAECHERAGTWLRGYKLPSGQRITHREGTLHPLFVKLAENLRAGFRKAEDFRTKATGRIGTILPTVQPGPHRDTRPVGWNGEKRTTGGIIIPSGIPA